ncbi:MAG: methyltransferase family protein [Candidatus Hodarchaeota archaeon]
MKKSLQNYLFVLIYHNIFYIVFIPGIYLEPVYMIALIMFQVINLGDALVQYQGKPKKSSGEIKKIEQKSRPVKPTEKTGFKWTFMKGMILLNLLLPAFLVLGYFENVLLIASLLAFWNNVFVQYAGIAITLIGGLVIIAGRLVLGESIRGIKKKDHELKMIGIYGYTRNPIYTGMFLELVGGFLVFKCLIMLSIGMAIILTIILKQIFREEKWLEKRHGERYLEYKRRTKRLIPFLF